MIDVSRQLPAASKRLEKRILKDQHAHGIKTIHDGIDLLPADYLVRNQKDEDRGHKIRALALQRNAIRNAKRLANHRKSA